ncbi:MAG: hypothetical protein JO267_14295 [Alphaproteobacteria bacterium]|nr:hypothetical protein [Alphaproteobacteria bacterium]
MAEWKPGTGQKTPMSDSALSRPGIGHNNPPSTPTFELRRSYGISCDWIYPGDGGGYPRGSVSYWRIYRDGRLIDSSIYKKNAQLKLAWLIAQEGGV